MRPKKKSFSDLLKEIPDVGEDSDFERVQETSVKAPVVFD